MKEQIFTRSHGTCNLDVKIVSQLIRHLRKMIAVFWEFRQKAKKWNGDVQYDESMFVHRRRKWLQVPRDR